MSVRSQCVVGLFVLLPFCTSASQTLRQFGYVVDADTQRPVTSATVSVVGGQARQTALTDAKGLFLLELPNVRPGDSLGIRIEKSGYEPRFVTEPVSEQPLRETISRLSTRPGKRRRSGARPTSPRPLSSETHGTTDVVTATVGKAPPRSARPATVTGPRLGTGPEPYMDISDEQVGQWAIEEANRIEDIADSVMNSHMGSPGAEKWKFTYEFRDCCMKDLIDLRTEIQRRLGVSSKDPVEIEAWTTLFPQTKYPDAPNEQIDPRTAREYATEFWKLGVRLKRRAVPRAEPLPLQFSVTQLKPDNAQFPHKVAITITAPTDILAGYVVVEHDGPVAGLSCDFLDSKLVFRGAEVENGTLARFLDSRSGKLYAMRVGKTPFQRSNPVHVFVFGSGTFRIVSVTYFEE